MLAVKKILFGHWSFRVGVGRLGQMCKNTIINWAGEHQNSTLTLRALVIVFQDSTPFQLTKLLVP